jgi:hypothetical protein
MRRINMNDLKLFLICFFCTKAYREKFIQKIWDEKSDASIIEDRDDVNDWLKREEGHLPLQLPPSLKERLTDRWEKYILPQLEKRGLPYG